MKTIVAATGNSGKLAEISAALSGLPVRVVSLKEYGEISEPEETGATFLENALLKACYYSRQTGEACLADDSGLEVDVLGGAPGVVSARFAGPGADDAANNRKLLELMLSVPDGRRTARFRCVLALVEPGGLAPLTAEGVCEGVILHAPRGRQGFGYDPLFFSPELGKTLSEVGITEKNTVSHRGRALRRLAELLAGAPE